MGRNIIRGLSVGLLGLVLWADGGLQAQDDPFRVSPRPEVQRPQGAIRVDAERLKKALEATVTLTVEGLNGKTSEGSGFIMNEGDASYVYTNAHVIDRAKKIQIFDHEGKLIRDMLWIEAFDRPFGKFEGFDGGDGVRLRLKNKRENSLTLSPDFAEVKLGRKVALLGDNHGSNDQSKKIEVLPGVITAIRGGSIQYSCNSRGGSSGGAVIDLETFNVIALNTLGLQLSNDLYTRTLELASGRGSGWGTVLKDVKWKQFKLMNYMKQGKTLMEMKDNLEVMILLSYLTPTGHGIYADWDQRFAGHMTLGDALHKHQDNKVVKGLIELSDQLAKKAESNIKTSNVDLYKLYINSLDSVSFTHNNLSRSLKQNKMSYYYTEYAQNRYLIEVADMYNEGIGECSGWFKNKIGVGGKVALGGWENLPPLGQRLAHNIERKILSE